MRGKLLRYLIRMSTRPTPYGMFAGVALSEFGEETDLRLADKPPRVRARPDMAWLLGLVSTLQSLPEVRAQLTLFGEPERHCPQWTLEPDRTGGVGEGSGQATVSRPATAPVRCALELTNLPISYPRLAAWSEACDASPQLIDRLLATLIGHGVLFTDLRPPLTRPDPAGHVARRLADVAPATQTRAALCEILDGWRRWDELPAADAVTELPRLAGRTAPRSIDAPAEAAQVDMALRLEWRRINHAVSETVAEAAALLLAITPAPHGMRHLDAYRRSFEARYGPNAEVPLVELLDPAVGLGPPPEHVHGIADDAERVAVRQRTLRALALDALRDHRLEVDLDDATLPDLAVGGSDQVFPRSLDLSVFVLAESPAAVDAGAFDIVIGPNLGAQAAGATSAASVTCSALRLTWP